MLEVSESVPPVHKDSPPKSILKDSARVQETNPSKPTFSTKEPAKATIIDPNPPTLSTQIQTSKIYKVQGEFGTDVAQMRVTLVGIDTCATISLIDKKLLTDDMIEKIEPCNDVLLRAANNTQFRPEGQIKLFIRLHDLVVPFYVGVINDLPAGFLLGTTFHDKYIEKVLPVQQQIVPIESRPMPILQVNGEKSFNNVETIHEPQPLLPFDETDGLDRPLYAVKPIMIEPYSQRLVPVRVDATGLVAISPHPNLYAKRQCQTANGIAQVEKGRTFYVWVANFSEKPTLIPKHSRVGLVTAAPKEIRYQAYTGDGDDEEEAHNDGHDERNPLDLRTESQLMTSVNVTLSSIRKRDPTKTFDKAVDQHFSTEEKNQEEVETDWRKTINIDPKHEPYATDSSRSSNRFSRCGTDTSA